MRTAHRLKQLVRAVRARGIQVRHEYLNGKPGGVCWFAGKTWIFIDLALSVSEQLEQIESAIEDFDKLQSANAMDRKAA